MKKYNKCFKFLLIKVNQVLTVRPSSVLYKTQDPFDSTTTHKQDYRVFQISTPPTNFKPREQSRHLSHLPFNVTNILIKI